VALGRYPIDGTDKMDQMRMAIITPDPMHLGQEAWGHVISMLLRELPVSVAVPEEFVQKGRVLDNFYIPPRYPNSHPAGAPFEHYGPLQSEEAIRYASEIIEFVRSQVA